MAHGFAQILGLGFGTNKIMTGWEFLLAQVEPNFNSRKEMSTFFIIIGETEGTEQEQYKS